jgi:hypothetical protein
MWLCWYNNSHFQKQLTEGIVLSITETQVIAVTSAISVVLFVMSANLSGFAGLSTSNEQFSSLQIGWAIFGSNKEIQSYLLSLKRSFAWRARYSWSGLNANGFKSHRDLNRVRFESDLLCYHRSSRYAFHLTLAFLKVNQKINWQLQSQQFKSSTVNK